MKALVTYMTQTGNTKKIAETIFSAIDCMKEIIPMHEVTATEDYDIIFAGFPVINFGPAEQGKKFVERHCHGKKTALFITHALPSEPADKKEKILIDNITEKCKSMIADSELAGFYHCQGELSAGIAEFLLKSNNEDMRKFGSMRSETAGHPDDREIDAAAVFAKRVMSEI